MLLWSSYLIVALLNKTVNHFSALTLKYKFLFLVFRLSCKVLVCYSICDRKAKFRQFWDSAWINWTRYNRFVASGSVKEILYLVESDELSAVGQKLANFDCSVEIGAVAKNHNRKLVKNTVLWFFIEHKLIWWEMVLSKRRK